MHLAHPSLLVVRLSLLAAGAVALIGAAPKSIGWNYTLAMTPGGGHLVGNPDAKVQLTQYVSYTCQHCAAFARESEGALQIGYISSGKVAVETRHMLRDPVDLTAAMLTNCGAPAKFALNHSAFMRSQAGWIALLTRANAAQRQRWVSGPLGQRGRAIASDFRFYGIMESRGYDRQAVDRCLGDGAVAARLAQQTKDAAALGVRYTPSFTINGQLLDDTFEWSELRPLLDASL